MLTLILQVNTFQIPGSAGNTPRPALDPSALPAAGGGRRLPRMAGPERRQHLIDVALRLFATRGFKGTTTHSIAAAAGVSEGVIFRHFRSKEELYDAILEYKARAEGFDRIVSVLRRYAEEGDDERLVLALALKVLDSYRRHSDFRRLLLYAALEGHDLAKAAHRDRKSTRLNSSHIQKSRMPSSA